MEKLTLEEILERFQNGEQRYDKDAYFKEAITAIHLGVGPYAVLDRVLKEHTILMHLHNEAVNKNRVAVAECAKLADYIKRVEQAKEEWAAAHDKLKDEIEERKFAYAKLQDRLSRIEQDDDSIW